MNQNQGLEEPKLSCLWALCAWNLPSASIVYESPVAWILLWSMVLVSTGDQSTVWLSLLAWRKGLRLYTLYIFSGLCVFSWEFKHHEGRNLVFHTVGSPVPSTIFIEKNWNLLMVVCVCESLSCVPLFATPWTIPCQASLCMEFSSQECWRGLPFSSPGDLPILGIQPGSSTLQAYSSPLSHLGWRTAITSASHLWLCLPWWRTSL